MKVYTYKGIKRDGTACKGYVLSRTKIQAQSRLERKGILVRELCEWSAFGFSWFSKQSELTRDEVLNFTQSLASLLESGVQLLPALESLEKQFHSESGRRLVAQLGLQIRKGNTFSASLESFPRVFEGFYIQCVRAGEVAGSLAAVLKRLASYLEKDYSFRKRVKRACAYPAAVLVVACVVVVLLLVGVVPRFEQLFLSLFEGVPLPFVTRCVLGLSSFFGNHIFGVCVVGCVIVFFGAGKRAECVRLLSFLPWISRMRSGGDMAQWARMQGVLMQAGVPLLRCLETSQCVVRSAHTREQLERARARVHDGCSLARALSQEEIASPLVLRLLETGEQTGRLAEQFVLVADRLEADLENRLATMVTLLEPCLIVGISLVVGILVVSLFMPMVGVLEQLSSY